MKRKIGLILVLAIALSVVGISPRPTHAQGVEITIWMTGGDVDAQVAKEAAAAWEAATGNTVTVEAIDWGSAHARILTAATSGEGPDIITGGLSWGIEFGELGGMIDLNERYPEDVAALGAADNPGIWKSIVSTDGAVYGVPYDLTTYLMFSRPDLLEGLGLTVPQTWDELLAAQEAIKAANENNEGGVAIGWGNTDWLGYSNFLWQAGGDWYDDECNVTIDSEEAAEALDFYASLYDAGVPTDSATAIEAGLDSGLYPVSLQGNWIVGGLDASYPDMVGKWQASPLPAGPTGSRSAFIGGRIMGIMSFSEHVDEAFDLIKYYNTEDAAKALIASSTAQNTLFIPPATDFIQYTAYGDNIREALTAVLEEAKGPPNCPGWEAATSDVTLQIQAVIFEGADSEDAVAEMAAIMEDNME
ncbi:MAG: extracellular solute-binding protein [Chloroflexi bacterium]|nr:extracellular solute-binding protein [Chloroflexota bacterium]